jgi:hypothetical protein
MDDQELRLECIAIAAESPIAHPEGSAVGVVKTANLWYQWIIEDHGGAEDLM